MAISLTGFLKGLFVKDVSDGSKQLILQVSPSATTGTSTTLQSSQTANRVLTFPDNSGTLISSGVPIPVNQLEAMAANKAVITDGSGFLTTTTITGNRALISDINGIPTQSITTDVELSYVSGVTSNIQTQLNSAAVNPMTTLGDILYENATPAPDRLPGNTTATKKFLTQTGTGVISAAPSWNTIVAGDVPTLNQNTTGTAANVTGIVALVNGGTGTAAASANAAFNALSPMTTGGDTIYGGASGVGTRLANGTSGQVLTSSGGTAAPTWTSRTPTKQLLTSGSNATYTTPTGVKFLKVTCIGGGGGGGGAPGGVGNSAAGGGGGSGAVLIKWYTNPAASYVYSVTSSGGAGGSGANNGNDGNDTLFDQSGSLVNASAGSGGVQGTLRNTIQQDGTGGNRGVCTGGDVKIDGGRGICGITFSSTQARGGAGGSCPFGEGGVPTINNASVLAATGFGAGGAGGCQANQAGAGTGGDGRPGLIIVEEYY